MQIDGVLEYQFLHVDIPEEVVIEMPNKETKKVRLKTSVDKNGSTHKFPRVYVRDNRNKFVPRRRQNKKGWFYRGDNRQRVRVD